MVLMDPLVACSGPENLAGVLFKRAELDQCVKPIVMTSATKITSSLGSNVLLRCDATGYPTPTLLWSREDGSVLSNPGNSQLPHTSPLRTLEGATTTILAVTLKNLRKSLFAFLRCLLLTITVIPVCMLQMFRSPQVKVSAGLS